jgi:hypothetical protein
MLAQGLDLHGYIFREPGWLVVGVTLSDERDDKHHGLTSAPLPLSNRARQLRLLGCHRDKVRSASDSGRKAPLKRLPFSANSGHEQPSRDLLFVRHMLIVA